MEWIAALFYKVLMWCGLNSIIQFMMLYRSYLSIMPIFDFSWKYSRASVWWSCWMLSESDTIIHELLRTSEFPLTVYLKYHWQRRSNDSIHSMNLELTFIWLKGKSYTLFKQPWITSLRDKHSTPIVMRKR